MKTYKGWKMDSTLIVWARITSFKIWRTSRHANISEDCVSFIFDFVPCRLVDILTDLVLGLLDPECEGITILRIVGDYQSTRRNIAQVFNLQECRCEHVESDSLVSSARIWFLPRPIYRPPRLKYIGIVSVSPSGCLVSTVRGINTTFFQVYF